ncbi:SNF2-related protein [Flavonifractor plautii]|uniref:SNF2-related protein n=2 Tax=Bacteria TaxID=2 RepID=UPI003B983F64
MGGPDEHPESAGGGDHPERAGIQLTGQEQQLTLFPSEQEQRQSIAEAESVETPSAFSISDAEWDAELRRGSGNLDGKLRIYALFLGMPDTKAAVAFLKQEYGSFYSHSQTYQDGSHGTVIYTTKDIEFRRYQPGGSIHIPWSRAAARLKELASAQDYFTPVEKGRWDAIVRGFQQRGEPLPPPVPRAPYPPPMQPEQLTLDALITQPAAETVSPPPASLPPFHEKYLPEILRHEDGSATWEALTKFFADHPEEHLRVSYLRLRFGEVLHQYPASDGTTIGFRGFPDQFHVWEGNYLNPTAITRLTWGEVCLLAEKEIARDKEQAIPAHEAEAGADEARTPDSPEVPHQPEIPTTDRHGALTQADIDAALRDWNGDMESKRAVVRYMKEHGREKDTAAWLQQEYGDSLPAFPVTADGAAGDVPWPKVQRRIAQLIQRDEFFTEQEQDNFENIDPVEIRERLAERGIVDGKVVDPEKLGSDPFIRQVMADVERATGTDALETYTTKGGHTYRPGDALDSHTDENDSVIRLVIDHVDEEHVWYTTPDMPERGVAEMFRPLFETYLDNGVFQPASAPEIVKVPELGPSPTVREIYEHYLPIVREKVLSDQAYRNAVQNSDRENAMLEGEEAIKRAVLSIEDPNFMRLYYDLTGFHNSLHQTVLEETYAALTEPAQPDLSGQPVSRNGDTIIIGAGEPTHEVDLAVSDEEWTEIQEAIPEDGAVPGVITIDGKPRDPLASAYGAGDFVYLEDREYKIASLERGQVELLDPTLAYPVNRLETRENFERLLKQDQRNGAITEFLPADLERFDQDLREVLASGLLKDRDKDYVSRWLRNGEGNTKLSQRLSAQFSGRVETMGLVTGEAADYRTTTTGMEAEIIWDDDKILATVSASWKELAAVLRALYQQELDGFSHTPVQREAVHLTGTPTYQVGDHVVLPAPDQEISGAIGHIGEQEIRIDTGPYAWSQQMVSRGQFEEWLRQDERNAGLFQPEVRETAEPAYTTQTTAVYPGDKNHLPYDVVVQTIRTGEPERLGPGPSMPPAGNFHITDDHLGEGGPKEKYRRNVEAIRTLKAIELEGRGATEAEQEVLSRYVGWGGLPQVFDQDKEDWHTEYAELKGLLDESEYAAARSSTLNAHYTSPTVIKAVYEALGNFGFQKGNILEPSCGVGNFFGLLPEAMAGSQLYGVELDSITGRIASLLYPEARIAVRGFEKVHFPNSFFDVAVGNVPFGQYPVNDPAYNKLGFHIHNYFFAKALDQVRPGGIVAFLTSRYTLDAKDEKVRRYLAQRAELLGAVRLPNNAFKANAGTEVVSDIIFLQKRDHLIDIVPDWVRTRETAEGFTINHYFTAHPEMVLGRAASESTQYGHQDYTVLPIEGADLAQQLHEAVGRIHGQIPEVEVPELGDEEEPVSEAAIPADPNVKNYSYTVVDGEVYFRENSIMVKPRLNATATARVIGMVELRDCVNRLIDLQMDDADALSIQAEQKKLNTLYDAFTARFGLISNRGNELAFSDDNSYYLLSSLEVLDEDGNLQRKADMFTKRTIQPHRAVTHVDTASEALAVSISEKARVDMPYMAQLTGKTEAELAAELRGIIFRVPNETDGAGGPQYAAADEYLSGNVRQKLVEAQRAADADPMYQDNVEALRQALPKDLDASEIDLRLGATWIDQKYIQQFMYEILQTPGYLRGRIRVLYSQFTVEWSVTNKTAIPYDDVAAYMNFGTERASAYRILEDTLNLRDVRIYDTIRDGDTERRVLNQKETTLAQQKQQALKDAFKDWIWKEPQRRQELVRSYNERFNAIRPREYDGKHIVFTGMNPEITLREHQRNAIAHILYGKNTLLAHEVGAGKTFEMVAAAMESKRLGLCRKSLFAVPNHLVEQWASEFLRLYPAANILVTTKKDFEARNRKRFCAKIATGDYDAVIMGHSQFERLPVSMARRERLIEEQIAEIEDGIAELEASGAERYTIKQLERMKKSLTVRLEKLHTTARKDSVVTFEQLGVDRLFVDEAHSYKNLFLYTKMRNVAGLSTSDAQKSSDMLLKCRYINEITGGKGVVFATGTPVSNSMTELYTMQRYLQVDLLEKTHLSHFDNWASIFGETVTAIELAPEGTGYRARTRFAHFFNLPELMSMFKETADIKTADQLNLPTPKAIYHVEKAEPSEHQKAMVQDLSERASKVHAGIDPHIDNMLKITSDGRKLGLDQRLINPMLPDNPDSKVNMCVNNILRIWREGQADKLTQLVFCDISTPKSKAAAQRDRSAMAVGDKIAGGADLHALVDSLNDVKLDAPFSVYEDIRDKLIAGGIPAQDRLIALHDLDCPWRPGDLEQRKGRIVRQGNRNQEVHIYRYVTEGTFDPYLWQTVENKQKFISQIMTSKSPVRSCEDVDETALSYAEIKAICAGDPLIREKMDLDIDVSRLRILKADHQSKQFQMEDNVLRYFPEQIRECEGFIAGFQKDMETLAAHPHPIVTRGGEDGKAVEVEKGFAGMVVRGDTLTDKDNAGAALLGACKEVKTPELTEIGSYRGFTMFLSVENFGSDFILTLKGEMSHRTKLGPDARGNLLRIDNTLADIHSRMEGVQVRLSNLREQLAAAKKELGKPFPQEAELAAKSARLAELNAQLDMGAQRKPASRERGMVKSSRPSVLEGLKRPAPPRTAEKKHQEEVR